MLIAAFPDVKGIGMKVAKALKADYTTIDVRDFPDGEFNLKLRKNPGHKKVVIINSLIKDPDEKIIETVLAGGIVRDYGAKKAILVATYFPYMRQDKHFKKFDSFSSKHVVGLFRDFDKIIAIDPHLHRIHNLSQLSGKAKSISVNNLIVNYIKKKFKGDFEIIGPDHESKQWARVIAKGLKKKVIILKKTRLGDKNIRQNYAKFQKSNLIIIDDIISTGRTLVGVIKMAKKQGARRKITCIGIHGILVGNADKLIRKHAELITTNTIPNKYAKINISPRIVEELKKER